MFKAFNILCWVIPAQALLAFASGALALERSHQVEISLKSKAFVASQRVYLSDIGKCSGDNVRCKEAIGIDVGQSPIAGRTGFIHRSQIEAVLEKEWNDVTVIFVGSEAVRVEATAVEISSEELRAKLESMLAQSLRDHKDLRIRISRLQPIGQVHVRPSQSKIDFPEIKNLSLEDRNWVIQNMIGNRAVQLRVSSPNDPDDASTFQCNAVVVLESKVPLLKQSVAAGQVISSDTIESGWLTMRRGYRDIAVDPKYVVGRRVRQAIQAGDPISSRYLESAVAVARNQPVKMIVKRGDLEISTRATAQQSGSTGQTIDVVNFVTKRKIRARIIDEQTVEAVSF